jgi:hypothetical protein
MSAWERKRVLIWGKTRPELSRTYRETVCTGGVFEDTKRLVRLYPIPLRFLNDQQVFRKYQWVEVDVRRHADDPRPESYRVNYDTITVVGEPIPTEDGCWTERARWVKNPGNVYSSVPHLLEANAADSTSLGLVRPDAVVKVHAERFSEQEKQEFWEKYRQIQQVQELPFEPEAVFEVKPIRHPDFRFKIRFSSAGREHDFSIFDWEVDALYFNRLQAGRSQQQARQEVIDHITEVICNEKRDTHFFLGNSLAHQRNFSIVGFWWPKKRSQLTFDDFLQQDGLDALLAKVTDENKHPETDTGSAVGREEW